MVKRHSYPDTWSIGTLEDICVPNGVVRGPFGGALKKEIFVPFHDNISGIDKMLREELKHLDVAVKFIDSQAEELIQLADNVASIFCKIINTIVRCWDTKTEWSPENEWILTQSARFLQKIGTQNIKFTVPIQSWALAFCVKDMFAPKCSKEMRNNLFFNSEYQHWCQVIIQNIAESDFSRHAACFDELYSSGGGEP